MSTCMALESVLLVWSNNDATTEACMCVLLYHRTANYKVTGMGVEDLEVSFPWTPYMGHHEGKGRVPPGASHVSAPLPSGAGQWTVSLRTLIS